MKAYAFIPARCGSKRIQRKNLREVGGVSLVRRAIIAAHGAGCRVVVSTDDAEIEAAAAAYADWVDVHIRPAHTATDHAQIESAIAAWWRSTWWRDTDDDKPDAIVLLQPTSPFRTAEHVREALRLLEATGADSVVGVTVGHEHHFAGRLKPRESYDGAYTDEHEPTATWYDFQPFRDVTAARPRTQDLRPMGAENGSIYCFRRTHWERTGNRMGGNMVALPMDRWEGLDVDDESDLVAANAIAQARGW